MTLLAKLVAANVAHPPKWLPDNMVYLTIMGSDAYGVSSDSSDIDFYGICIPPKTVVFPHLAGEIAGFGTPITRFDLWQQHHVPTIDGRQKTYDFSVYSIVRFFQLAMENNPNVIDALFTPRRCVVHSTAIGEVIREHRKRFLHKGAWHKFKGYAYAQMAKIDGSHERANPKRAAMIAAYGYDVKHAYHVVRLLNEIEQILTEQDLDLERNREQLKSIRKGEWKLEYLKEYFAAKEMQLEAGYMTSGLPQKPDEEGLKELLLSCLEMHYGAIERFRSPAGAAVALISDIEAVLDKHR
ncbi:MAG: nucleotidyltransferase domain-containing protein [Alphaproteobacteria bacterium]|nr:nucleotidyltransferase domain-containing protein [Alphaproteobacteria bacterium]